VVHKALNRRWFLYLSAFVLAVSLGTLPALGQLPVRLTDQEFWKLATDYSEPDGTFHSENLVSNELRFQTVVPALVKTVVPGRAYVGVGSEQNFTYIAATKPAMAFLIDIRHGNLDLHLVYKALFEMSANRAEFVSKLFSRSKPEGLSETSTATEIFTAYSSVPSSQALFDQNLKDIKNHLQTKHAFKLSAGDLEGIDFVYNAWFQAGPGITYQLTGARGGGGGGLGGISSYAGLMTTDDGQGTNRSYLASEDSYKFLKDLEARNLIVPVVGNFGGPKALRAVAAYLKEKKAVVSAFYTSNVEQYLRQDGIWENFCRNVSAFPVDATSTFIRSERGGFAVQTIAPFPGSAFNSALFSIQTEVSKCAASR
jgi:hypothetical protein